jgi:hypothetical protein
MSKGDTPRPLSIPPASYDANWTRTFGKAEQYAEMAEKCEKQGRVNQAKRLRVLQHFYEEQL